MAYKITSKLVVLSLIIAFIVIQSASSAETKPQQRRRRPSTTTESDLDVSPVPVFPPRFMHQRRMNAKAAIIKQENNKSVQSDIAESCKSEPGCEWGCSDTDVYDCTCRCKFDPSTFNLKNQNARFL